MSEKKSPPPIKLEENRHLVKGQFNRSDTASRKIITRPPDDKKK